MSLVAEEVERVTAEQAAVHLVSCVEMCHGNLSRLRDELGPNIQIILLSETGGAVEEGVEVVRVPPGTKLSKIRSWVSGHAPTGLLCICDPDMTLDTVKARGVILKALAESRPVVAYGRITSSGGSLLREVIAFDKGWSHRVVRPLLWRLGVGASVPGQFLVVSASLFAAIDPSVDSYLDDLYLGLFARSVPGAVVICEPVVVGSEESRQGWVGLVAQRLRWMRGFVTLVWHMSTNPVALGRLVAHFLAYHGFPVLAVGLLVALWLTCPLAASLLTVLFVLATSAAAGRNPAVGLAYWLTFPFVHVAATLGWWLPLSGKFLQRR